jgi:hypothetical protein
MQKGTQPHTYRDYSPLLISLAQTICDRLRLSSSTIQVGFWHLDVNEHTCILQERLQFLDINLCNILPGFQGQCSGRTCRLTS